jgi:DNA gyrase subunit A
MNLEKLRKELTFFAGLVIALDNLDEVIALIRASQNPQEALKGLMANFNLDEIQAKAILDMRLERLTRLERNKIVEERERLLKEIEYLKAVLASERMVMGIIKKRT